MDIPVDLETIRAAAARIAPYAVRTPVMTSHSLDKASGASVFLKCENFQKIGAFKFRGAMNAVLLLDVDIMLVAGKNPERTHNCTTGTHRFRMVPYHIMIWYRKKNMVSRLPG